MPPSGGGGGPARLIHLRRPPQLHRAAERFVPQLGADALQAVERRWTALCATNPRYFDGDVLHVLGHSRNGHGGVSLHVAVTSYRFYAVQRPGIDVFGGFPLDCGVRPLGAKAITTVAGRFALARRSASVAFYPGMWEFVPGGGLEPADEPASCVLRELREETALEPASAPVAVGLVYDPQALSWEVVHRLEAREAVRAGAGETTEAERHGWEHDDRVLAKCGSWPEPLADVARAMIALIPPQGRPVPPHCEPDSRAGVPPVDSLR